MSSYVTPTSDKKKKTALFLCIFGGLLGAHYFYVCRIGRGLLAVLTINFCGFGWFADTFKIAVGRFKDNTGMYLRE